MKFKSGKYRGVEIDEVAQLDRNYLEFLLKLKTLHPYLKKEIKRCLTGGKKETKSKHAKTETKADGKVEERVMEALTARGWSVGESQQMINRLKQSS